MGSSLFDKIARTSNSVTMRVMGERCMIEYPKDQELPIATDVLIEFSLDTVVTKDGYSTRDHLVASILKKDMERFYTGSTIHRGDRKYRMDGLNERSVAGKTTTSDEWVIALSKL